MMSNPWSSRSALMSLLLLLVCGCAERATDYPILQEQTPGNFIVRTAGNGAPELDYRIILSRDNRTKNWVIPGRSANLRRSFHLEPGDYDVDVFPPGRDGFSTNFEVTSSTTTLYLCIWDIPSNRSRRACTHVTITDYPMKFL